MKHGGRDMCVPLAKGRVWVGNDAIKPERRHERPTLTHARRPSLRLELLNRPAAVSLFGIIATTLSNLVQN
jgi:hypothetical protein